MTAYIEFEAPWICDSGYVFTVASWAVSVGGAHHGVVTPLC
jgi:hypothetical protein